MSLMPEFMHNLFSAQHKNKTIVIDGRMFYEYDTLKIVRKKNSIDILYQYKNKTIAKDSINTCGGFEVDDDITIHGSSSLCEVFFDNPLDDPFDDCSDNPFGKPCDKYCEFSVIDFIKRGSDQAPESEPAPEPTLAAVREAVQTILKLCTPTNGGKQA